MFLRHYFYKLSLSFCPFHSRILQTSSLLPFLFSYSKIQCLSAATFWLLSISIFREKLRKRHRHCRDVAASDITWYRYGLVASLLGGEVTGNPRNDPYRKHSTYLSVGLPQTMRAYFVCVLITPSISYLFIILPVEGCSTNSRKLVFFKSFSQRSCFKFYKMFYPGCGPSIFS